MDPSAHENLQVDSLIAPIFLKNVEVNRNNFIKNGNIFTSAGEESILHTVQMSRIFQDSKTFVDMKLKYSSEEVENHFRELIVAHPYPSKTQIKKFVEANFSMENQMEDHVPEDWNPDPKLMSKIVDLNYSLFAQDLNSRWKTLCRKIKAEVRESPDRYSLLYLPYPVMVPGGRFREIYYWDCFWIIRGLIQSEMLATAKGLLLNFAHLISQFGMIPNGGRCYYVNRSQPPLFIQMVKEYEKATGDKEFVKSIIDLMVEEFNYWQRHHLVEVKSQNGKTHRMVRYNCEHDGPRPESYFEDYELAQMHTSNDTDKNNLYWELKTGAETGWDYSSRWFVKNESNVGDLEDTKVRSIIPVDLNCFYALNARILSEYYFDLFNDTEKSSEFALIADILTEAVDDVLWNPEDGIWYDFDMDSGKPRNFFTPSNLVPLWTETFTPENKAEMSALAVEYLYRQNFNVFPGGLPTTITKSGQQWDFPNCWPPLEHMVVQGLEKTGLAHAKELAFSIAERRVRGCYLNFLSKGHMFEKYDATSITKIGGGGEYEVQLGFGWTNGVILDFLDMYADRLTSKDLNSSHVD